MTARTSVRTFPVRASCLAFALCCAIVPAFAQQHAGTADSITEPSAWQPGKDVVWLPTPQALVDAMLDLAKVTSDDFVIDLGSGDGRLVIAAAKRGARALGIEYNEDLVAVSSRNAEQQGVAERARFAAQDLYDADLSQATVVTMFLLPQINLKLRPRLLELEPGTRLVSNTFGMGDWKPDETTTLDPQTGCSGSWCTALLWIVPAQVGGTHELPQGKLTLEQTFQMLSGTLERDGETTAVQGRVVGREVFLRAGDLELRAVVKGDGVEFR